MKKLLLGILSVLCMQTVFAADVKNMKEEQVREDYPVNLNVAYKINIHKVADGKESNYEGHFVFGRVSYFNEMNNVSYISEVKCKGENDCDSIKGTETVGTTYIVDALKPKTNKDDIVAFLQINEKALTNQRKVCEENNKRCVDFFDISVLNFKETLKMKEGEPKTVQYNNVTYTITLTKE